jgi:hypothetical protein
VQLRGTDGRSALVGAERYKREVATLAASDELRASSKLESDRSPLEAHSSKLYLKGISCLIQNGGIPNGAPALGARTMP